ncbi:MAG: beta-ketoacyl-[acyl-carrier-protein] synthase family protein [Hyphomicrobiaceae bacterium]
MKDVVTGDSVVVTGMGLVSPLGDTVDSFWSNLVQGVSGIARIEDDHVSHSGISISAPIRDFDPRAHLGHWRRDKTILHSDRYSWIAAAAANQAIAQSALEVPLVNPYRAACMIGSAVGGQITGEKATRDRFIDGKRAVHPMFLPRLIASSASAHVGIEFGVKGPTFAICSADASAAHAIGIGCDYIKHGLVDVAIVGGSDSALTYGALLSGKALGLLSKEGCYPFAANRSGTVLAEGAAVVVLESQRHAVARGAEILAQICSVGCTSDATDMITPNASEMARAMRSALHDAQLKPHDVDYLNAHGAATISGDQAETSAIKSVFEEHAFAMGVSSTKSMHGHAMGASAALEVIACIKAIQSQCMPPTIGLNISDPDCDLDYVPNAARTKKLRYAMSNSFALGGFNTSIVVGSQDL